MQIYNCFAVFVNLNFIQFTKIATSQLCKIISRKCPPFAVMQAWIRFSAFSIIFCNISVGILRISLRMLVLGAWRDCGLLMYTLDLSDFLQLYALHVQSCHQSALVLVYLVSYCCPNMPPKWTFHEFTFNVKMTLLQWNPNRWHTLYYKLWKLNKTQFWKFATSGPQVVFKDC